MTTDVILSRDLQRPIEPLNLPPRITAHEVGAADDAGFHFLEQLYRSDGFPADWARQMIDRGSRAVVVVRDEIPVASGLLIRKPYYVQEIGRTFDAGSDGDYYFGDFVTGAFRGQGLHRLLIRARLAMTRQAGRRWAMAMTRLGIPASRENYLAEGFCVVSELRACNVGRFRLERHRRIAPNIACGKLSREGLRLPLSYILRRAQ